MSINVNNKELSEDPSEVIRQEFRTLLREYQRVQEELNIVDANSERFDALCLDLKSINFKLAAVKKELNTYYCKSQK